MKYGIVIVFLTTVAVIAYAADRESKSQRRVIVGPGQTEGFNPQPEPTAQRKPAASPATGFVKLQVAP